MATVIHHPGLTVSDMKEAIHFFCDLHDLSFQENRERQDPIVLVWGLERKIRLSLISPYI